VYTAIGIFIVAPDDEQ